MAMWLCGYVVILKFVPLARSMDLLDVWHFCEILAFPYFLDLGILINHFGIILDLGLFWIWKIIRKIIRKNKGNDGNTYGHFWQFHGEVISK